MLLKFLETFSTADETDFSFSITFDHRDMDLNEPVTKRVKFEDKGLVDKNAQDGDETQTEEKKAKGMNKQDPRSLCCPYLDTINRNVLDFDFEKLCSVSLSKINVYACLVCGKYFQGRGVGTHAYLHSVAVDHHVFLNLSSLKFYCLPDNYQIIDSSLSDITYVLKPIFSRKEIALLDSSTKNARAFDGTSYLPGMVGLNNIKANDYCNVILHALSHVSPIRNYFLLEQNYAEIERQRPPGDNIFLLVQRFGELIRKLWNPRNFKAHVSPHEMLQAVVLCSKKKFQITQQEDPVNFLSWFLNSLHIGLNGGKKRSSSIINRTLRGDMKMFVRKEGEPETESDSHFLFLTLDLPPPPLFKDEMRENIIPQVPLATLLSKFNGMTEKEYKNYKGSEFKRFKITYLPDYLILVIKRFTKNTFFREKNPTIVNFPDQDFDLGEVIGSEKKEMYNLIANVVHEGPPETGKGTYRLHVLHSGSGRWFELQDLHVTEILPQMISLSESYIQVWKKKPLVKQEAR